MRPIHATLCLALFAAAAASAQTTKPAAAGRVEKPPIVTAQEWGSKPQPIPDSRKHTPKYITIHHAGVTWKGTRPPADSVRALQVYGQQQKSWPDLPYHFLIAPDGTIFEGRSLEYEPESNTKYELQGHIGVELMGNFQEQRMSPEQLQSLVKVVAYLCDSLDIPAAEIKGHRDRAEKQTTCPGKDLYRYIEDGQIQRWVSALLEGKPADVKPREALPDGPTEMIPTKVTTTQPATAAPGAQ